MIRVLHCVVGMNYGGYETFIMNVYRNIDRTKIQFDFLTSLPGVFDEEIEGLGGKIYRIPFITKVGPFIYKKNLDKFFKEHPEYTIVHSHMDKFSGSVMRSAKKYGVNTRIAHSHSTRNEGGLAYQLVKDYYGRMVNPNCTHRFACSQPAADWMFEDYGQDAVVIYNGIDVKKYLPNPTIRHKIRNELNIENNFVTGHVGRFLPIKNHDFLIDIFKEIKNIKNDAKLLLIGTGEEEAAIKNKSEALGLSDDIIFYGTTNKVNELLQAMDAFILPSLKEGLGIAVIEAQCAGLYCTVSDTVPSLVKITDNIQFLSLDKTAEEWAKAIVNAQTYTVCESTLTESEYNINKTAAFLQNFYIERA